ncbi:M14 family metallopeptidase [Chitinimonas koreensis]|uniref:M14 family metallopeptidase n=1 Tax=Chitinimonas koreensis TaxID=356302 RepID=UPI00041EC990|nr:M14 family metallopeptidase [Chitinimonas koreensis]QNM98610.1 succinylglutamate desuccinylase/aspartoacylase family protein [Chitinimonas koreensis]
MRIERHRLLSSSLGTARELVSLHYGTPGQGEKVYLQASLHADELPGMLVLHHLRRLVAAAEARGEVRGEIVMVPVANPVGLAQNLMQAQMGRFEFSSAENFNRHYPDFLALIGADIENRLGVDEAANKRAIRGAIGAALAAMRPATELASLRHTLVSLSFDADVLLDLHCDYEAVMHVYTETPYLAQAEPLYRHLGAQTVLLAKGSGGASFDEAQSAVWWQLQEKFGGRYPIPLACFSATVELRGQSDVDHEHAAGDAARLYAYLQHRGVIAGTPPALPAALCEPTPLAGSETLHAPHAGVIAFLKRVGERVEAGEVVAEIVDPLEDRVTAVRATVAGLLYARENRRYAVAGMDLCKVAGAVAFRSGYLLSA